MIFRNLLWTLLLASCLSWVSSARAVDVAADRAQVEAILAAHDRLQPAIEEYFASVAEDVLLLPDGAAAIEGKAAYRRNVEAFYASAGSMRIRHEIIDLHSFAEVVIVRGRAVGTVEEPGRAPATTFETKNLFVFRRTPSGKLQVWQIIFNDTPRAP